MNDNLRYLSYCLFPRRCAVCGRVVSPDRPLCKFCVDKIKPIEKEICTKCGSSNRICDCKYYTYHFKGIVSPFYNRDEAQEGIYRYKFHHNTDASLFFASNMAHFVRKYYGKIEFDCITAVPMHRKNRRLRGFDHSKKLAVALSKELDIPYKILLFNSKRGKTQHKLNIEERFSNVFEKYRAYENSYKNVLLVDDIKTTGATLDACARELMLSGTENVYCVTAVIGS